MSVEGARGVGFPLKRSLCGAISVAALFGPHRSSRPRARV